MSSFILYNYVHTFQLYLKHASSAAGCLYTLHTSAYHNVCNCWHYLSLYKLSESSIEYWRLMKILWYIDTAGLQTGCPEHYSLAFRQAMHQLKVLYSQHWPVGSEVIYLWVNVYTSCWGVPGWMLTVSDIYYNHCTNSTHSLSRWLQYVNRSTHSIIQMQL